MSAAEVWPPEKARAFMDELGALCARYETDLAACGCCGGASAESIEHITVNSDGSWIAQFDKPDDVSGRHSWIESEVAS